MTGCLGKHALFVEHAEGVAQDVAPPQLATEEQVFGNVQGWCDCQILVDSFDALPPRIHGAVKVGGLAIQPNFAFVGHDRT